MSKKILSVAFISICLMLIILNPYTHYGKPGVFVAIILTFYGLCHGVKKQFAEYFLVPSFVLLVISAIGAVSSVFNGIFQLNHLLSVVSFIIMLFAAYGLWVYCQRSGITRDEVLSAVLLAIVLNSVIIVLELNFESFRQFIENFLDPLDGGSIDYAEGYRLRGVAASGGAGLSVSVPAALAVALHLLNRKILPFPLFIPIVAVLLFSVVVIGRTGLILMALPLLTYMVLAFQRRRIFRTLAMGFVLLPILVLLFQFIFEYFTSLFGEDFIIYAIGFMLDGAEGIEKEGTVGVVAEFLTVLPLELPQALVGYGFYGGSDFSPWTDSGYSRMFLSVGFVFGFIFYVIIFRTYFLAFKGNEFLVGTLILLLAVAEIKEPLLFSGVASRMFLVILVFCWLDKFSSLKFSRMVSVPLFNSDDGVHAPLQKS